MRGACIRLSRMMPVPLRLPHNYTPVFFNTLHYLCRQTECARSAYWTGMFTLTYLSAVIN